ncbi:MAG TPA: cytosine permease [Actinomycetota bacterium]|nr:cytosine permease [Actinomycetota bacterium]
MASVADRDRTVDGTALEAIEPVAAERRTLSGLDLAVLWGDLSVGLLVIVTGALLVTAFGLSLPLTLLAILVGGAIGCLPLALVARAGHREGVATMVLFRPILGERGSAIASAVNVIQLVGWTAVEFWAMAQVANVASSRLLGLDAPGVWTAVVAAICTVLAIGGPIVVIRRWLERFGIYVLIGSAVWITVEVLLAGDLGTAWSAPRTGELPFWLAVDLVIVMPVSWLALAADYTRFARSDARAATATYASYLFGNTWFYALGAFLAIGAGTTADAVGVGSAIVALAGGAVVLLALLVGESDNAFADIYSAAVSTRNVVPRIAQRSLVVAVGTVAFVLALTLSMERYELFLLLLGSVFVPLFGVFAAEYLRSGSRFGPEAFLTSPRVRWVAFIPWLLGFAVYHWCAPAGPAAWADGVRGVVEAIGLPFPLFGSRLGASLPAFLVAFALTWVLPRRGSITR